MRGLAGEPLDQLSEGTEPEREGGQSDRAQDHQREQSLGQHPSVPLAKEGDGASVGERRDGRRRHPTPAHRHEVGGHPERRRDTEPQGDGSHYEPGPEGRRSVDGGHDCRQQCLSRDDHRREPKLGAEAGTPEANATGDGPETGHQRQARHRECHLGLRQADGTAGEGR